MEKETVIHADGLTKQFGNFTAVDHISFDVARGEVFGFLGANGAGKTTAMRMLCGLSRPTSGTGTVAGFDITRQHEKIKRNIGSCNLCCMNSVPTDTGCCINQCNHITAALHQLEGYDQTDISGTKHQNFVSRFYPVQIHHRLCGSCADDSRKIPALKGNHIFCGSCSNDNGISFVVMNLIFDPYHNFFIQSTIDGHLG